MALLWRVAIAAGVAAALWTLGLSTPHSVLVSVAVFSLALRKEIGEVLFPFHFYLKECLSIRGLESEPKLEKEFRAELGKVLLWLFPERKPTACCCVGKASNSYDAVVTLHRSEGQLQVRVTAESLPDVTKALILKLMNYNGQPAFRLTASTLLPACRSCSLRKAHHLINRTYSELNPFNRHSKWSHVWYKLKNPR